MATVNQIIVAAKQYARAVKRWSRAQDIGDSRESYLEGLAMEAEDELLRLASSVESRVIRNAAKKGYRKVKLHGVQYFEATVYVKRAERIRDAQIDDLDLLRSHRNAKCTHVEIESIEEFAQ